MRLRLGIVLVFFLFATSPVVTQGQDPIFVDEPVIVQNYSKAPFHLSVVRTWNEEGSSEWWKTCFSYTIRNKSRKIINNFHYEIGPKGKHPYVMGAIYITPEPLQTVVQEMCVPNNSLIDEKKFLFRLTFVESNDRIRSIWSSKDHRKAVKSLRLSKISLD